METGYTYRGDDLQNREESVLWWLLQSRNRRGFMMLDIRLLAKGKIISEFDDLGWRDSPLDKDEEVDIRIL